MSKFLTTLGKKTVVAGAVDRYLKDSDWDGWSFTYTEKEKDDAFHPSSAYECAQESYARITGDKPRRDLDATSRKTFMTGHFWHALIQHSLVEMGYSQPEDIEKEHRRDGPLGEWWARGFIDVAHCNTPTGDYLVDIKTMNGVTFRQPNIPISTWNKYLYQLQLYMDWEEQDHAVLLCVNKDYPHDLKEYVIPSNRELVSTIYDRWTLVTRALAEGTPPPCDCGAMGKTTKCSVAGLYE